MAKKTWAEKLNNGKEPVVELIEKDFSWVKAGTKILIVNPLVMKARIEAIPRGQTKTVPQIREELAKEYGADMTCPMSSGIFVRIAAEAAWDEHITGKSIEEITPFWRVIQPKDKVVAKLRCGGDFIEQMRQEEGIV
ncbi:MAG: hypothetical protein KF824_12510 [Fimbriimonadaceae bacterium]|nr:MAG: hypothetical protein KF824_12510 [Fimbriimonadaceae bacterium]